MSDDDIKTFNDLNIVAQTVIDLPEVVQAVKQWDRVTNGTRQSGRPSASISRMQPPLELSLTSVQQR